MASIAIVLGKSGAGKSTSIKNLNPDETVVINPLQKRLPFKGSVSLYNKEKCIKKTIHSVIHQTFSDFEIIVVNDGSTDNSVERVMECSDDRIIIVHKNNGGVSSARNIGIRTATTKLLFFLDGDDTINPNCLESLYKLYLEYSEANLFCGNYSVV